MAVAKTVEFSHRRQHRRVTMALTQDELNGIARMSQEERLRLLGLIKEARALFGGGGMRMSAGAVKAMTDVVDDKMMRDIVKDLRTVPEPGFLPPTKSAPVERGTGWTKPMEHGSPSGLRYIDQAMDMQDQLDKIELERRLRGG
jgi:hypothetical protein